MTPSQQAKRAGLKNLLQVSELTGVSIQTLSNWAKNKPDLFATVLRGTYWRKTPNEISWALPVESAPGNSELIELADEQKRLIDKRYQESNNDRNY